MRLSIRLAALALLSGPVLACVPALAQGTAQGMAHGTGTGTPPMAHPAGPAEAALMDSMKTMSDAMTAAKMTGDPDADFVRMMIGHHQGAVAMARVEVKYGQDAAMKALARRIVADQEREITQMTAWLKAHPGR